MANQELSRYSTHSSLIGNKADYFCKEYGFHDYGNVRGENDNILVENCIYCGHIISFRKVNGKIDNLRYGETHILYFMQATHPLYKLFHGEHRYIAPQAERKRKAIEETKELFREAAFSEW